MAYLDLMVGNVHDEHICCGFSDKKAAGGYELKRDWLAARFAEGYIFRRLDERAKVFIEYGSAETAWIPVEAPGYLMLGCFWVSGRYKDKGHGRDLMDSVIADARRLGKAGVAAVVGSKKFHFMSDTGWLLNYGFTVRDTTQSGFSLLTLDLSGRSGEARFTKNARCGVTSETDGLVVYYTNRCPFCEYYVREVLPQTAANRGLPLKIIKLESLDQARSAPSPATIFSLFKDGKFVTTDLSVCLDNHFDKVVPS